MTSANKVILIGSLGRDPGGVYDAYLSIVENRLSRTSQSVEASADAARKAAEARRPVREPDGSFTIPKKMAAPWMNTVNRTAAFFHAAKVDARNRP